MKPPVILLLFLMERFSYGQSLPLAGPSYSQFLQKYKDSLVASSHTIGFTEKLEPAAVIKNVRLFPFDIVIINNRYYIRRNNSMDSQIPGFTEITTINGVATDAITTELKQCMIKDGYSQSGGIADVEKYFSIAYSNFIGNSKAFGLSLRMDGTESFQTVSPLLKSEVDSIRNERYRIDGGPGIPLRFTTLDSLNAAMYKITWFNKEYIAHKGHDFRSFTDSVFFCLKDNDIQNLIIDLRGNVGGWTAYGKYLFSYFIDEPVPYMEKVETQKAGTYSFEPIITSPPGYADTIHLELNEEGLYSWTNYPSLMAVPRPNRFKGKVYILTDEFTRSCAAIFSSLMREHTNAIFIGNETGTTRCGTGGMVMFVQLPYTGLNIYFSIA